MVAIDETAGDRTSRSRRMKATMLRGAVVTAGGLAVVLYDNGFIAVPGPVWAVIAFATAALLAAPWSDLGILRRMSGSQLQSTLRFQALDEEGWTRHRILSNSEGDGAVAVVVDGSRVLFIDAQRPAVARNLWELPRGQADAADKNPQERARAEYSALRWIEVDQIRVEIADDRIRDGISISALALAWAKGELNTSVPS